MQCFECDRLLAEYERIEGKYAAAIHILDTRRDTVVSEYIQLRKLAHEARIDAESARLELEQHRFAHSKAN